MVAAAWASVRVGYTMSRDPSERIMQKRSCEPLPTALSFLTSRVVIGMFAPFTRFKPHIRFSRLITSVNRRRPLISREDACVQRMSMQGSEFRKILVAFDGSQDSIKATRIACTIANRFGSSVIIAHVYSFAIFAYGGATPMPMPDVQPLEDAARSKGKSILDRGVELAKEAGVNVAGELMEAPSTVQALIEYAAKEKVDLIVVGNKGTTGFKKLIMGSVSSGLAGHADCSVLVVR